MSLSQWRDVRQRSVYARQPGFDLVYAAAALSDQGRMRPGDEVALEKPQLLLTRDSHGHWNYEQFIKPAASPIGFSGQLTFADAALLYSDQKFPTSLRCAFPLFSTRLTTEGIALVRSDKSIAFDVKGTGQPELARVFPFPGILI